MKISNTMKKILLLLGVLACVLAAHVVFAQINEGVITYEVKINMHRRLPPEREGMKNSIPEFNIHKDQLIFNGSESLYKPIEEEEDEEFNDEGGAVRMRFRRPKTEQYFDQASGRSIAQQDIMGKKYLVEDSIRILPWRFGSEEKTVQGYTCKQATYYHEERKQNVVAWYAEKLKPFLGPEGYNSLPGTVLLVDINDGERIITAQKIEARPLKKNELKAPTEGKRVTAQEFQKIMEEQRQRMGAGGGMIIRN